MGIRAILTALREGVTAAVPKSIAHVGFSPAHLAHGSDPYEWAESTHRTLRECVVRVNQHAYSFEGSGPCRLDAEVTVLVAYPHRELPGEDAQVVIAEDAAALSHALAWRTTYWGGADSIWTPTPPGIEEFLSPDGRPLHWILTVPLMVRYREG